MLDAIQVWQPALPIRQRFSVSSVPLWLASSSQLPLARLVALAAARRLLRLWLDDESSARLGPGKMDWYLPQHSRFTRTGGTARLSA